MASPQSKAARLKQLILDPKLLVMPGVFDPVSARLVERADFPAAQCSGLAMSGSHLGLADYSFLSMTDMVERTRVISAAVDIPVMADGDTGFGNQVNTWYTVKAMEAAGAAGINLEDQVVPKRCGHLEGKKIIPLDEAVMKLRAASDARTDPDFVINARTDALAVAGMDEVIRRGNAYLSVGATMIFVDGITSIEEIQAAVSGIQGPVAINLVHGGKSPSVSFSKLQEIGVARVSLPVALFQAAIHAMSQILRDIRDTDGMNDPGHRLAKFSAVQDLIGMTEVSQLEKRYQL